ncbi:bifunctional DNA primase/helicase [Trinickia symbiotica]|uniref:Bifunctional DNA primase/helicase n=1 Tax=Trinickia symbiotica TaxID=863227 RepID=A0A2T3XSR4_9BURK|nr:toprim domain-containing protein [Trinickia symbiotica]PTB19570.1 bifunctional DNA primase/helicase [Trinickia symbiotica]
MSPDLHDDITRRLTADFDFKENENGRWLQQGRCPECGKRELFASASDPWVIRCGRENKCGYSQHVKALYQDLFERWSERYVSSTTSPNAAADAYMRFARGFDLARVSGWYSQEQYYDAAIKAGSATVRFAIGSTWWERLIDEPGRFGKKKANFKYGGSYAGNWWKPPTLDISSAEELWLVEGIFDAISFDHHGIAAVALLSCNNYPEEALANMRASASARGLPCPRLVWALDGDRAGRGYTKKWVHRAREAGFECEAAVIPQRKAKIDWNDLHQRGELTADNLAEYRYHGALMIAATAFEKAVLIYERRGLREFPFDFDSRLYWFKLDMERFDRARDAADQQPGLSEEGKRGYALNESGTVCEIANCLPTALYYQANALTDESWYYFRIEFPNGARAVKNTFTGGQVASSSDFKKRLLAVAPGAFYTGNGAQLDRYLKSQMAGIRSVQTVDFVGYSKEHGAWIFNDLAVKGGQCYELNEEDFFDIGKLSIKTLNQSVHLTISRELNGQCSDWLERLWHCFAEKGIIALAFWFGSLFAEQIRAEQKSFPFLEIVGEAGAGKSTLVEFLWKLLGRRDYEGFDPSKSSLAARARNFAQVSAMPVVLIEADRSEDTAKARTFDWDELKTAYNGRSVRAVGVKNGGNETREPPFRGAIVISQNAQVSASDAVLQRIVHLHFDRGGQTQATKRSAEALERIPVDAVSAFLLASILRETQVLNIVKEATPRYEVELLSRPDIGSTRIAKNHAQLMALVDALACVVPLGEERAESVRSALAKFAAQRQRAINADHPIVQEFWDMFEYLDGDSGEPRLNHSADEKLIAVNLNHFATVAADRRQTVPPLTDLKRHLRTSRTRRFLEVKTVRSALRGRDPHNTALPATVKCWVFER